MDRHNGESISLTFLFKESRLNSGIFTFKNKGDEQPMVFIHKVADYLNLYQCSVAARNADIIQEVPIKW
jgi:hypothetical protein